MSTGDAIPFLDLISPHLELEEEIVCAVRRALRSAAFIGGEEVETFEKEFAKYCKTQWCVGVNSGTDALRFALIACGVDAGDYVITVPNTFVATAEAIVQAGGEPLFVDVEDKCLNMDPTALRRFLETQCRRSLGVTTHVKSGRVVRAVVPVHLYGHMCDMDAIAAICEEFNLIIVEDACQAHGSQYFSHRAKAWLRAGSIGRAAAFSFYPGKNLGACGEAGAVTTNDPSVAERVRMIRDHGQNEKYHHVMKGYNGRLDALQAAILRVKLPHLEDWNLRRRKAAHSYQSMLGNMQGLRLPVEAEGCRSVYHLYVLRADNRDQMQESLSRAEIGSGLHYPVPLHLQRGYADLNYQLGEFPVAEKAADTVLSLPMYPGLTVEEQGCIAQVVQDAHDKSLVKSARHGLSSSRALV